MSLVNGGPAPCDTGVGAAYATGYGADAPASVRQRPGAIDDASELAREMACVVVAELLGNGADWESCRRQRAACGSDALALDPGAWCESHRLTEYA